MGRTYKDDRRSPDDRGQGARDWQPRRDFSSGPPRPFNPPLFEKRFAVEHKEFRVRAIRNQRGDALEVKESSGGRDNFIVIPATGKADLMDALQAAFATFDA